MLKVRLSLCSLLLVCCAAGPQGAIRGSATSEGSAAVGSGEPSANNGSAKNKGSADEGSATIGSREQFIVEFRQHCGWSECSATSEGSADKGSASKGSVNVGSVTSEGSNKCFATIGSGSGPAFLGVGEAFKAGTLDLSACGGQG